MSKCPKCEAEVYYLRDFSPTWREFTLTIGENGLPDYEDCDNDYFMDSKEDDYECPECGEVLFTSLEEAIKFLKGGDLMERLDIKLIEARRKLDEFNLMVTEFRIKYGMSNEITRLYHNMGNYGQDLELLIEKANKLDNDYEMIYNAREVPNDR